MSENMEKQMILEAGGEMRLRGDLLLSSAKGWLTDLPETNGLGCLRLERWELLKGREIEPGSIRRWIYTLVMDGNRSSYGGYTYFVYEHKSLGNRCWLIPVFVKGEEILEAL